MNSRGKPLTTFEHFKAEMERNLRSCDAAVSKRIMEKIDIKWTDMLWDYRGDDNVIDDEFLRYFRFICDVICYKSGSSPQGKSGDEFDLLDEYFAPDSPDIKRNLELLEDLFDCWCELGGISPGAFLARYISHEREAGKIRIDSRYEIDIFGDCLNNYADIIGSRNRKFPLNRRTQIWRGIYGKSVPLCTGGIQREDFTAPVRRSGRRGSKADTKID